MKALLLTLTLALTLTLTLTLCTVHTLADTLDMDSASGATITIKHSTLTLGTPPQTIPRVIAEAEGPGVALLAGQPTLVVPSSSQTISLLLQNTLASNGTSLHIHGLVPPQTLDGVPYVSALPIGPGRSRYRAYPVVGNGLGSNTGSYFLHSHYGLQHGKGVGLPLIVQESHLPEGYPRPELEDALDVVAYLEDVCPYLADDPDSSNTDCADPYSVLDGLQADWNQGAGSFNFSRCMAPGTDSDVRYRYHLLNGKPADDPQVVDARPGQWIRIRFISSAGMTNYKLVLPTSLSPSAVAVDGQYIVPYTPEDGVFWIAVAQRVDVLVQAPTAPGNVAIFAQATSLQPSLQSALLVVVGGAGQVPPPGTYTPDVAVPPGVMTFAQERLLSAYAPPSAPLPDFSNPDKVFAIDLTGDNGFKSINRQSYRLFPFAPLPFEANPDPLVVDTGDVACIDLVNFNADAHPMHLHGHTFKVVELDGVAVDGALRDTLLMERGDCHSARICFVADAPGVWPFHCHMNYHLAAGMLTTVEYSATPSRTPSYTAPPGLLPSRAPPSPPPPTPSPSPSPLLSTKGNLTVGESILVGIMSFIVCAVIAAAIFGVYSHNKSRSRSGSMAAHSAFLASPSHHSSDPIVAVRPMRTFTRFSDDDHSDNSSLHTPPSDPPAPYRSP